MIEEVIIIILFILLFVILYTRYDVRKYKTYRHTPRISVAQFSAGVQPGDILLGHWDYDASSLKSLFYHFVLNRAYTTLAGDIQTHVSVIVKNPNTGTLYVYDNYPEPRYDDYFQKTKTSGPALMLPEKFIAHYGGNVFWMPRIQLPEELHSAWQYIMNSAYKYFDQSIWRLTNSVLKLGSNPRRSHRNLFCSENAADVLNYYDLHFANPNITNPQDIKNAAIKSNLYDNLFLIDVQ